MCWMNWQKSPCAWVTRSTAKRRMKFQPRVAASRTSSACTRSCRDGELRPKALPAWTNCPRPRETDWGEDWHGLDRARPGANDAAGRIFPGLDFFNRKKVNGVRDGSSGRNLDGEDRTREGSGVRVFETNRGIPQGTWLPHVSGAPAQD